MIWLVALVAGIALALSGLMLLWAASVEMRLDAVFSAGYEAGRRDTKVLKLWPRRKAR